MAACAQDDVWADMEFTAESLERTLESGVSETQQQVFKAYRDHMITLSKGLDQGARYSFVGDIEGALTGHVTFEYNTQTVVAGTAYREILTNATRDYQDLRDISVMLLNAPRSPEGNQTHSLQQNQAAREKQLEHFFDKYQQKFLHHKVESMQGIVKTYADVKEHIEGFFSCLGNKSKMAVIVFNGHGSPQGHLSLENEEDHVTNTTFINDVHDILTNHRSLGYQQENGRPINLPVRVKVILAQCYGHKYDQDDAQRDTVQVVALSSPECETTTSTIWWDRKEVTDDSQVVNSKHEDLSRYADTRAAGRASEYSVIDKDIKQEEDSVESSVEISISQQTDHHNIEETTGPEAFPPADPSASRDRAYSMSSVRNSTAGLSPPRFAVQTRYAAVSGVTFRKSLGGSADLHQVEQWMKKHEARVGRKRTYYSLPPSIGARLALLCSEDQPKRCVLRSASADAAATSSEHCGHRYCQSRYSILTNISEANHETETQTSHVPGSSQSQDEHDCHIQPGCKSYFCMSLCCMRQ